MSKTDKDEIILSGISGSPGICIGRAYLVNKEGVDVIGKYFIPESNLANEIKRFKSAVQKAKDELQSIIEDIPEELNQHVYILEAHMALHEDKMLYGKTIEMIKQKQVNAEWALKTIVSKVSLMFQKISDPYLKSRSEDVIQVGDRIMRNLIGAEDINISEIDKRVILVAQDLSPADTSQKQLDLIKGFVTDFGGKTSHTSIIVRSFEIPAVLGLGNATSTIKDDDIIIVDGTAGHVVINPRKDTIKQYKDKSSKYKEFQKSIARDSQLPAKTQDGFELKLMGNIELSEEIGSVNNNGGDGIGLFRTEFLYLSLKKFPSEEELFQQYKKVVELMAPKSVTIRTLDINGDKAFSYAKPTIEEDNPALGLRAIRFCLKKPEVFKTQLKAILRAAVFGDVKILVPMISGCAEIIETKKILQEAIDSLKKQGVPYKSDIEVGVMIEVPSAVIMADAMADLIDFFSIGTNDLIQYALAIDRQNRQVAHLYNALHPSVIRMLKSVADVGKAKNIKVAMCGEMAGDPICIPVLLGLGISELSMNPKSIPVLKNVIRTLKYSEAKKFLEKVLKLTTVDQVMEFTLKEYGNIISQITYQSQE